MFDLNPIDVLNQRELKILPPHFAKIKLSDHNYFDDSIKKWIDLKLKGRYCLVRSPAIGDDDKLKSSVIVGFEDQKELTYFLLACTHLRRK